MNRLCTIVSVAGLTAALPLVTRATILRFDGTPFVEGQSVASNYGSQVSAASMGGYTYDISNGSTPFITSSFPAGVGGGWVFNASGFGDLTNVGHWTAPGDATLTFGGNTGFSIWAVVQSFDLATSNPAGGVVARIQIFNAQQQLLKDYQNTTIPAGGHVSIVGASGANVRIVITPSPELDGTLAIDNVRLSELIVDGGCFYTNCDGSTGTPALTAADFTCFLAKFRAGDAYANCDGSTTEPKLTASDFTCYLKKFRAGCS